MAVLEISFRLSALFGLDLVALIVISMNLVVFLLNQYILLLLFVL